MSVHHCMYLLYLCAVSVNLVMAMVTVFRDLLSTIFKFVGSLANRKTLGVSGSAAVLERGCWTSLTNKSLSCDVTQGLKFPPVRLPGTSRFSVGQPKMLSPLALWASRFWVQLLVKRCRLKAMISFSSTVGLVSCKPTPFQPFISHFHPPPPTPAVQSHWKG